jgi:hypothetical protein
VMRRRRNRQQAEEWAWDEPVTYSTKVFVRSRKPRNTWVSWNHRLGGGPELIIRGQTIQVLAPQGRMLESRNVSFSASSTTMWRDQVGWAGTPFDQRECIRLRENGATWKIELALTPKSGIEATWEALIGAGVHPNG